MAAPNSVPLLERDNFELLVQQTACELAHEERTRLHCAHVGHAPPAATHAAADDLEACLWQAYTHIELQLLATTMLSHQTS